MGVETEDLTNKILKGVQRRYPDSYLWRNNTGSGVGWSIVKAAVAAIKRRDLKTAISLLSRPISWGLVGSSDIFVILGPKGRFGGIEVKVGYDTQSIEQEAFEARVTALGGFYILARSVEECLADIAALIQ